MFLGKMTLSFELLEFFQLVFVEFRLKTFKLESVERYVLTRHQLKQALLS